MDDPCFYGFPTYGEAGPKAAQDCGGEPVDPDTAHVRARRGGLRPARRVHGDVPAGRGRAADLHQDLPLHADPGPRLRGRSAAGGAGLVVVLGAAHGFKFASVLGRILAELSVDGATPSAGEIGALRGSTGRSCSRRIRPRPGWSERVRTAHGAGHRLRSTRRCATVPPIRARRGPQRRRLRCASSLRGRMARVLAAAGPDAAPVISRPRPRSRRRNRIIRVGTDQDLQVLNPWHSVTSSTTSLHAQLRPAGRLRPEPRAGARASPSRGRTRADGMTHTFKIRTGHEVVGRRARDVRGRALHIPARPRRRRVGARLPRLRVPRAVPDQRRASRRSRAPDARPSSSTTEFPTTLLPQAYVPILPKHIWSKYTLDQIADPEAADFFKNEPPVVGTGPYQAVEWEPGNFVRFEANPNYWGKQGAADEVIIQHFASARHHGPGAASAARSTTSVASGPTSSTPSPTSRTSRPSKASPTATPTCRSTPRATPRATAARRRRSSIPFRDALGYAIDNAKLVDATLGVVWSGDTKEGLQRRRRLRAGGTATRRTRPRRWRSSCRGATGCG